MNEIIEAYLFQNQQWDKIHMFHCFNPSSAGKFANFIILQNLIKKLNYLNATHNVI